MAFQVGRLKPAIFLCTAIAPSQGMLGNVYASSGVWWGYIPPPPTPRVHLGFSSSVWKGWKNKLFKAQSAALTSVWCWIEIDGKQLRRDVKKEGWRYKICVMWFLTGFLPLSVTSFPLLLISFQLLLVVRLSWLPLFPSSPSLSYLSLSFFRLFSFTSCDFFLTVVQLPQGLYFLLPACDKQNVPCKKYSYCVRSSVLTSSFLWKIP